MKQAPLYAPLIGDQRLKKEWVDFFQQQYPVVAPQPIGGLGTNTTNNPRRVITGTVTNTVSYQNTSPYYQQFNCVSQVNNAVFSFTRDGTNTYAMTPTQDTHDNFNMTLAPGDKIIGTPVGTATYVIIPL